MRRVLPKEIREKRDLRSFRVFEEKGRATGAQRAIANLGYLENRIDFHANAFELAFGFEEVDEVSEVFKRHNKLLLALH
jgi:hypothetical protein